MSTMTRKLKKGMLIFTVTLLVSIFLLASSSTSASIGDFFNKITGFGSSPQSLSISVKANTPPIVGNITLDMADNVVATESGNTSLFFSFVVTDSDGLNDIVNNSAVANISRTGETTRYNDTFVDSTLGGCNAVNNVGTNGKNFSCRINIVFYDGAGLWNISARINDSTGVFVQNTTKTFTLNELTALVINPSTLSFPTVGLTEVNISARNNLTINNTGNDDISGREASGEYINFTAITLVGETTATTVIPTNNFSVGTNNDAAPVPSFCDLSRTQNTTKLINTTAAASAYNNFSAGINGSFMLAQAANNFEVLSICLLDVPDDLTGQNYSTSKSGAWSVIVW